MQQQNKKILNALFVLALLCIQARCDLPVHCLKSQIQGKWTLYLTKAINNQQFVTCGHKQPDDAKISFLAMQNQFQHEKEMVVTLHPDNTVENHDSYPSTGTWTMVYDEGFNVQFNQLHMFAFSKYSQDENGYGKYQSDCSQTLVGWWNDHDTGDKGCYKALKEGYEKQDNIVTDAPANLNIVQPTSLIQDQQDNDSLSSEDESYNTLNEQKTTKTLRNKFLALSSNLLQIKQDFQDHSKVASRINSNGQTWEADVHPMFAQMTIKELNQFAGRRKHSSKNLKASLQSAKEGSSYNLNLLQVDDTSDLPKSLDLRQYVGEVRQQGNCGSCYIFSTLGMLQARLKMKHNEDVTLSVQHSIDCNMYNQGCHGGYPYLVEKFFKEYELVPESCKPYKGYNGQCSSSCDVKSLEKTYKVENFRFIGGAYGKSSERNMMEEMLNNGPIAVSFEPNYDFMMYKKGVYQSPKDNWLIKGEQRPEWEKVDHSVLCVGWGEDNGVKYWLLQNTWGPQWGEKGYFRMRRGVDESAIESLAEAADPVIIRKNQSSIF